MVDFTSLLRAPAGQGKKPEAIPADTYPGIVKAYEFGDQNKNHTPYVRLHLVLNGAGRVTSSEELASAGIDVSTRQFRRDYFLCKQGGSTIDPEVVWRLDELLRGLGLSLEGRSYDEVLPEVIGKAVEVEIQQYLNQTSNEVGNQVGLITAA